jgi:branched-chain amino acid transport system substrate-binding protein
MLRSSARIIALALVAALGVATFPRPVAAATTDPYTIPVILSLTGGAAFLGKSEGDALGVVEQLVNSEGGIKGRKIHFAIADDQSNSQVALQLANGALAQKPTVLLGSTLVGGCNVIAALVKTAGPVQYCFSPGVHPPAGSFSFSSGSDSSANAAAVLHFFHGKHWNRIAFITSNDATGQEAERTFTEAARRPEVAGLTFITREHFNPTDVTVSAQMARIAALHPDAVIAWSTGTGFGTLLHGINDAGLDVPIVGGNGNLTYPQLIAYKSFMPAQMYFPGPRFFAHEQVRPGPIRDAQKLFFASFAKIGVNPDVAHSFAWDPALIVVDALRHVGLDATPDALRAYIESSHSFAGINGLYDFRDGSQRGLAENTAIVVRWNAATATMSGASKPGGAPLP